jgi:hypothetical protein
MTSSLATAGIVNHFSTKREVIDLPCCPVAASLSVKLPFTEIASTDASKSNDLHAPNRHGHCRCGRAADFLASIIVPFVIAFVLAVLVNALVRFIQNRWGAAPGWAVSLLAGLLQTLA